MPMKTAFSITLSETDEAGVQVAVLSPCIEPALARRLLMTSCSWLTAGWTEFWELPEAAGAAGKK